MNISTASIETAIRLHTTTLDAKRAELHKVALGEIVVRNPQHHLEQLSAEVTRQQGIIQGLTIALVDIKAQQEGYGAVEAERAVVEDFPRTERVYMTAEAAAAASR